MHITVVGAGIIGLTSALRLLEAGHDVAVVADRLPAETTSAVAAALWYPYRAAPRDLVTRWSARSYVVLSELATDPASGVRLRRGCELFRQPTPDPWWADAVPALDRVPRSELPDGYADGLAITVPVVDMPVHLRWLQDRLNAAGVSLTRQHLSALSELPGVVVNCSGPGARTLVPDDDLRWVQGQVLVVDQVGVDRWLLDQSNPARPTYVVPRSTTIVLGGTAVDNGDDPTPDDATAADIFARCTALLPSLERAAVVAHRVGFRPVRSSVRLEREQPGEDSVVISNYGHGGAGVTMAYGCAEDVVQLVQQL